MMRKNLIDPIDDSSSSEEDDAAIKVEASDLGVAARIDFDS